MSAPTPAPGDDRPREGYYPDPSIPGYVRYWSGASWVPGTSRPAPAAGETLPPPPGVTPARSSQDPGNSGGAAGSGAGPDVGAGPGAGAGAGQHGEQPPAGIPHQASGTTDASGAPGVSPGTPERTAIPEQHAPKQHAPKQHAPEQHGQEQRGPGRHGQEQHGPEQHGPGRRGSEQNGPEQHGPGQPGPGGERAPYSAIPGQQGPAAAPAAGTDPYATGGHGGTDPYESGAHGRRGPDAAGSGTGAGQGQDDPRGGSAPSAPSPGAAWGADASRQSGYGGAGRRVTWGAGGDPRMAQWDAPTEDAAPAEGTMPIRGASPGSSEALPAHEEASSAPGRPGPAAGPEAAGPEQHDGTFTFRRIDPSADRPGGEGTVTMRAVNPADPAAGFVKPPALPAGTDRPHVPLQPGAAPGQGPGSGRYGGPQGPQTADPQTMPYVPQQPPGAPGAPGHAGPWGPEAAPGGAVPGADEPVVPWRPPASDPFLAMAQDQAATRPASLGRRFAARLLDTVVVGGVTAAVAVPLGSRAVDHIQDKIDAARMSGEKVTIWLIDGTTGTSLAIVLAVLLVLGGLYEALPTGMWGRTLGKKLLGLQVRDIESHQSPGVGAALRRWLVYVVPLLLVVGVIGVLWCLFDRPWRQSWHDKAAHTFVSS